MADKIIYPIFDKMMSREDKEQLLGQRGIMIWMTGLSGSGKSTVALGVERELHGRGILCRILDGDNIRKLFVDTGIVTIACFVSPTIELRQMARDIIDPEDFREVYIATPLAECERRDVKGLYARARRGEVKDFTGISAPFEAPEHPDLSLDTSRMTLQEEVEAVMELVLRH